MCGNNNNIELFGICEGILNMDCKGFIFARTTDSYRNGHALTAA